MNMFRWGDFCKIAAPNTQTNPIAATVHARPDSGAVSTAWNTSITNARPQWGYAFKCPDCDTGYGNPNPAWSPNDRARFMKEVQTYVDRHKRMCALRKNSNGRKIDFMAVRRAYLGK